MMSCRAHITLNLINPDHYIAEHNITRFQEGQELDFNYLKMLSANAMPPLLAFYEELPEDSTAYACIGQFLRETYIRLQQHGLGGHPSVLSANMARDFVWAALNARSEDLPESGLSFFRPNCGGMVNGSQCP